MGQAHNSLYKTKGVGLSEDCDFSNVVVREKGPLRLYKGSELLAESQTTMQRMCVEDVVERLEVSAMSAFMCSCAVFTDEVLVAEANRSPFLL